jgi:hypothetical protein
MYVYCTQCKYDSGDEETAEELAEKVNYDGGKMERKTTPEGKPLGWKIVCPRCQNSHNTRID